MFLRLWNRLFLAYSHNWLWYLRIRPSFQEFELAERLADVAAWTGQNPIQTRTIAILHACHLYRQLAFPEALHIFTKQLIDPSHVLSLFPDLIPETVRSQVQHPPGLEVSSTFQVFMLHTMCLVSQSVSTAYSLLKGIQMNRPTTNLLVSYEFISRLLTDTLLIVFVSRRPSLWFLIWIALSEIEIIDAFVMNMPNSVWIHDFYSSKNYDK